MTLSVKYYVTLDIMPTSLTNALFVNQSVQIVTENIIIVLHVKTGLIYLRPNAFQLVLIIITLNQQIINAKNVIMTLV
jgi:hypothetical protein